MRLATLRQNNATVAVMIDGGIAVEIEGVTDVGQLIRMPDWRGLAQHPSGPRHELSALSDGDWAPVIPQPSKIVCVGLNYRSHILEMGRELPEHPTLFAKYPEALIGAHDTIVLPAAASGAVDWEAELAVVIGSTARHVSEADAAACIAGYSIMNDVTMRDFQYRTPEWFQGKTFEDSAPFGPVLVTPEELADDALLTCEVDGEVVQSARIDDLVFSPAAIIAYVSQIVTLNPGDVIATGTPGGVGHARSPQRYLAPGSTLVTAIEGIGELRNVVRAAG
jgi:acylpyruvate hydrolase